MNSIAFVLVGCIVVAIPWIKKQPFMGLLLVIAINPFEPLFPLPLGLSLGRVAGVITIGCWLLHLSNDALALQRWKVSSLKSTIWLFPAACVISAFLSPSDIGNITATLTVLLLVVMALMTENLVDDHRKISVLMIVVIISSLADVVFPLLFHFGTDLYSMVGIDPNESIAGEGGRVSGLRNNPNALGLAACMGLYAVVVELSAQKTQKFLVLYLFIAVCLFGGLILSGSRTHLIAFFVFSVCYFGLRLLAGPPKGRAFSIAAVIVMLAVVPAVITMAPEAVQKRLNFIGDDVQSRTVSRFQFSQRQRRKALESLNDDPVFGVGLLNFRTSDRMAAHDTPSSLVAETGLAGTLAFLVLTVTCLVRLTRVLPGWRYSSKPDTYLYAIGLLATLVSMMVAGFGGYIVFYQRWFWIVIGLSAVLYRFSNSEVQDSPPR